MRRHKAQPPFRMQDIPIYLFLGIFCFSSVFAFCWVIMTSLKTNQEFYGTSPWSLFREPMFSNYVQIWSRGMAVMFKNSFTVASLGTLLTVALSCLAAYPISRIPFRWNQVVLTYFMAGLMVPYLLTAIPLYFAIQNIRNIIPLDSRLLLIILYGVLDIPFSVYIMTGFFKSLPTELEESAAIDGASPFRTFWQIMLPLAKPGIIALIVINFLSMWNEFFYALIFINKREHYTVSLGLVMLETNASYTGTWTQLFAAVIISIIPVLIVFAIMQKQISTGLTVGALKG